MEVNNQNRPLDGVDRQVLRLLQKDGRRSSADLARSVKLSPPGLMKRLRKLEDDGVIRGYAALLRRESVGLDLLCFVQVTLAHHQPAMVGGFSKAIQALPEVLECHHMTGDYDYLMKVVVRNHLHLERFLVESLTKIPGVDRIRTSIVLKEIKSETALPLETDHE
jgi:Lrp/AsnC family leucine-responsive transcriptional regulator